MSRGLYRASEPSKFLHKRGLVFDREDNEGALVMLRNVFHVGLLRRVCLLKQAAVPPVVADVTNTAIWQRNFTLHTTSEETMSQHGEPSSDHHEKKAIKKFRPKWVPKGKPLHSRVLSEHQKADQQQMRREMRNQPDEEIFGQFTQERSFPGKPQERRRKSTQHKGRSGNERQQHTGAAPSVLIEQQLELADSEAERVAGENGLEEWSDTFGTMADPSELQPPGELVGLSSTDGTTEEYEKDDDDEDHVPLREYGRHSRKHAWWYGRQLEKLGKKGQVYEAIQMLEETMIQEDRVQPVAYNFTVVIGICGRAGYTKKAFSLFAKMKKYKLIPEDPTYTALFNACANSPWREDGLKRANQLVKQMGEKGIEPNNSTLKAVVKAYGRLGELQTAFRLMDRMLGTGHGMDSEAWKHLLMACISDKEAGLNHAVQVWRLMRKKKMMPDLDHYNLLLRAARDCNVGDDQHAVKLLGSTSSKLQGDTARYQKVPPLTPGGSDNRVDSNPWLEPAGVILSKSILPIAGEGISEHVTNFDSHVEKRIMQEEHAISILDANVPNILNPRGMWRYGSVSFGRLDTSEARLGLLGGLPGVLSHMTRDGVKPDIRTFSQLLDMCPKLESAEDDLLAAMRTHGIKPDADLLNQIIRRRCQRKDLESATNVLQLFGLMKLVPNLLTYGSLALGCRDYSSGLRLLSDMENAGMYPTLDIFGILLRRSQWDFRYKKALCRRMHQLNIFPTAVIVEGLEDSVAAVRKIILQKERGEPVPRHFQRPKFSEEFKEFMLFYKGWLLGSPLEQPEHPWTQYRQPTGGIKVQEVEDQKD